MMKSCKSCGKPIKECKCVASIAEQLTDDPDVMTTTPVAPPKKAPVAPRTTPAKPSPFRPPKPAIVPAPKARKNEIK